MPPKGKHNSMAVRKEPSGKPTAVIKKRPSGCYKAGAIRERAFESRKRMEKAVEAQACSHSAQTCVL